MPFFVAVRKVKEQPKPWIFKMENSLERWSIEKFFSQKLRLDSVFCFTCVAHTWQQKLFDSFWRIAVAFDRLNIEWYVFIPQCIAWETSFFVWSSHEIRIS